MSDEIKVIWPTPGNTITTGSGFSILLEGHLIKAGMRWFSRVLIVLGNAVALKVYKPANRPFEEVQLQWEKEHNLFNKMRHPNVVAIYDAFICDNLFYIVLERAWGNLYKWVQAIRPPNEQTAREIARQLLFAVHFIHTHGVVHRDITIYNTLVFEGRPSRERSTRYLILALAKVCTMARKDILYADCTSVFHPTRTYHPRTWLYQ